MRTRDLIILFVCIVLAAGLLIAAGLQLDPINKQRQEMKLVMDKPENIPPSLIFTAAATGAFKGLLVDFLWIRADRLKEEGQFFDARQLAELITILQPRFASVWEFQAWNMAYNISVAIPNTQPEQRWRWIKNGYELLRDQAIDRYKLKDVALYHELAWIFQHKIGGISDDDHKYYKLQLALQMDPLLSTVDYLPSEDEDESAGELTDRDNKYFDLLAKAPDKWEDLIKDANVAEFVNALKSADEKFSDESNFVNNYLSLRQNASRYNVGAGQVIDNYRGTRILEKFDIFAKAYKLRKVWKLNPEMMRKVNQLYGPIEWDDPNTHLPMDWRLADAHAIYWAETGLEIAAQDTRRDLTTDETNTDRIVFHSLQNLFGTGKLLIFKSDAPLVNHDPSDTTNQSQAANAGLTVFLRPDLRYFNPYNDYMLKMLKKYDKDDERGAYESMQDGHRNMLKDAVFLFYQSGHRQQAQEIYDYMRKLYPLPGFNISLQQYATNRLFEKLETLGITDATKQITAILKEAWYYYAIQDDDAVAGREKEARDIYDYYQSQHEEVRVALPDFDKLKFTSMQDFRTDTQFPEYIRINMFLGRLYQNDRKIFDLLMAKAQEKAQKTE
jgi:hypothetical protein